MALDFSTTPRIVLRPGAVADLPAILRDVHARHALLVTDPGLVKAGLIEPAVAALRAAGIAVTVYDQVQADPPVRIVVAAADAARQALVDAVIGFGGGSAMDTAKLVAYLVRSPCDLETIYGVELAQGARLPLILVPTTAGTGSEVTPISIVTTDNDEKRGVVSRRLLPDVALLDPDTTLGLPAGVTAATGIDAMVHAIEAYTSRHKKNPISDVLARQALALLSQNLPVVLDRPGDRAARGAMLLGSCLAGMAFANAPVAAVHALAYPLGGRYHVSHGLSNSLMLVPVLNFNASAAAPLYGELAAIVGAVAGSTDGFIAKITDLVAGSGVPRRLREVGVTQDSLDLLAEDAMRQTRLLVNNPVEVTLADARRLYGSVF
ncbi:iron-containing alcohol dehydrogenase [Oleomonas cavernae]|uniref:Alcohol dehydrogenase 2 n=1 Tax=Oleomonas cavernae TaxID=2320859 RepID=A0A418WIV3_9PROT|nr:iron-containing alcohol dehydrogenase [Oleomonas cavernae]